MAEQIERYGPIGQAVTCQGEPVHFGYDADGELYVWSRIVCEIPNKDRYLRLVSTGEPFIGPCFGSVLDASGQMVHLVEYISDPYTAQSEQEMSYLGYSW